MKFYQLNYDFGDPLNYNASKYYQNYDNAKRAMDQLVTQAMDQKGAKKYSCPSQGHYLGFVWVINDNHTILNVTITELRTED